MESFAMKIKYGNKSNIGPMLEEKDGRIVKETPKQDVDTMEAVIEVMANASNQIGRMCSTHSKSNMVRSYPRMLRGTLLVF